MSSDAAAFFANKKRKNKKAFKFNANLIDASTISSTVHIAAPAISTSQDYSATNNIASDGIDSNDPASSQALDARQSTPALVDESKETDNGGAGAGSGIVSPADQWDDEALAATMTMKKTIATPAVAEVRDMRSLDPKRHDQGHIAEKLRVEQTKAQLAAAREGMEREAEKARLEKERKQQEAAAKAAATATAPRFGVAAAKAASAGGSGIWLPKHRQLGASGPGGLGARGRLGTQQTPKFDVENEELFPDLAAADKILEKKEKEQQVAFKVPKKTPVGGGATWASKSAGISAGKASASTTTKASKAVTPPTKAAPQPEPPAPAPAPAPEAAPTAVVNKEEAPAAASKPIVKKTKKKKKDLSTFKPSA